MKKISLFVLLAGSTAAMGQGTLVDIPPHSSIYNGYSRGYNFVAGIPFTITRLELPPEAMQAGDTASFLVQINGAQVLHSIGNASAFITPNILVNAGDSVDIIGNWSPAVPGSFTAHNSYGNTAPYATTILGVPHTLMRTGWQWDVGDPFFAGTYLPPTSGSIGRVFMYVAPTSNDPGACCFTNGTCSFIAPLDCVSQGGAFAGTGVTCATANCPQPGSCCFFDGTCQILLQTACTGQGGTFTAGGTCTPNTCPPPPPLACAMSTGATSLAGQPAPAGGTWSECARDYNDPTTANTTAGFNALAGTYRIADDFQVSAGQTITAMRFPAYQTGALGTTITALTLQIWDGPPDNPASTVVFGDTFTNRMTNVSLSNIYRCFNTVTPPTCGGAPTLPDSGRHIQWVDAGNLNIQLPAGTYWVDFDVAGTAASGPWVPPSTSDTAIGRQCDLSDSNALQSVGGVWQPLNDTGQGCAPTPVQQKVYFEITATGGGCYANCDNSTTAPILNVADFTCFLQRFAAGESYANCDNSTTAPVLNVADFTCFLQAFAAGCP